MATATLPRRAETYERMLAHLVDSVERTPVHDEPFSHFYIEGLFPDDIYAEMIEALPAPGSYQALNLKHHANHAGQSTRDVLPLDAEGLKGLDERRRELWLSVGAALSAPRLQQAVFRKLSTDLCRRFGQPIDEVLKAPTYPKATLFRDTDGYEIPPHPDTRHKIVTMQIYLPRDRSQIDLGTALYRRSLHSVRGLVSWHGRFAKVKQFPFLPNSGYAFAVSNSLTRKSWHGREELPAGSGARNTILNLYFDEPGRRY